MVKREILTFLAGVVLLPVLLIYGLIYFSAWRGDVRERRERRNLNL